MSKLKINDLSFCETELLNDNQVQGGFLSSLANRFYDTFFSRLQPLEKSVVEDGYQVQEFYDPETNSSGMMISMETENSMTEAGIVEGNLSNGGEYQASFATASSFDTPVAT